MRDRISLIRNQTHAALRWKHRVLTTGWPRKSPWAPSCLQNLYLCWCEDKYVKCYVLKHFLWPKSFFFFWFLKVIKTFSRALGSVPTTCNGWVSPAPSPSYSEHSLVTSSVSITWELVRNAGSWVLPQNYWIRICSLTRPLGHSCVYCSLRHAVCHTAPWYCWYIGITGHTVPPNYSEKFSHRKAHVEGTSTAKWLCKCQEFLDGPVCKHCSPLLPNCCCSISCVQHFAIPWTEACQASLSFTISQRLLKLMSIE